MSFTRPFAWNVDGGLAASGPDSTLTVSEPTDASAASSTAERTAGTVLCGVTESAGSETAIDVALELSSRLNLRLILAAIGEGILDADDEPIESLTTQHAR